MYVSCSGEGRLIFHALNRWRWIGGHRVLGRIGRYGTPPAAWVPACGLCPVEGRGHPQASRLRSCGGGSVGGRWTFRPPLGGSFDSLPPFTAALRAAYVRSFVAPILATSLRPPAAPSHDFLETGLTDPVQGPGLAAQKLVKYHVLAGGIPALSYAAAANPVSGLQGFDMQSEFKTGTYWPTEGHEDPESAGKWIHSDFKNVALSFVHKMYTKMIELGGLDE